MSGRSTERKRRSRAGDREDRKAEASELYYAARTAAGLTIADLAAQVGVGETKLRAWEDPNASSSPAPLDGIMVESIAKEAVRLLALRAGMVAVEVPSVEGAHDDLRIAAEIQRETSEAVTAHLAAIADGYITAAENRECQVQIDQAIAACMRLKLALKATEHEPVVGVRRGH